MLAHILRHDSDIVEAIASRYHSRGAVNADRTVGKRIVQLQDLGIRPQGWWCHDLRGRGRNKGILQHTYMVDSNKTGKDVNAASGNPRGATPVLHALGGSIKPSTITVISPSRGNSEYGGGDVP